MARRAYGYEFAVDLGIENFALLWCWAALREEVLAAGRPVSCRAVARHLGWPWPLTYALLHQGQDLGLARRSGARWFLGDLDPLAVREVYRGLAENGPKVWTLEDLARYGVTLREQTP